MACLGVTLISARAQNVVASYDFSSGSTHWVARTADQKNLPTLQVLSDDGSKDLGKSYLSTKTDGRLGTGVRLNQFIQLQRGQPYGLSFWVKVADAVPISYRLFSTMMAGPDYAFGDRGGHWHVVPTLSPNTWTEVTLPFSADAAVVGLDIVAGTNEAATTLSIADVQVVERDGQDFPVALFDFTGGPGAWQGRGGGTSSGPPVQVKSDVPQLQGKPYLTVQTDGKLGTGFRLSQVVEVIPSSPYKLSFWIRASIPVIISYRVIGTKAAGGDVEYADQSQGWHQTPPLEANRWTQVEYPFTATDSPIGLDIVAGADHVPAQLSISDPEIISPSH